MNTTKLKMRARPAAIAGFILPSLAVAAFAGMPAGPATTIGAAPKPASFVQDNLDSSRLEAKLFLHRPGFVATAGATR